VGEDIAWIKPGKTDAFTAINPESVSSASRQNLRRRPPQLHEDDPEEHHLHQCRDDARWRCVVEGMTETPPARLITGRARSGRPIAQEGGASQRSLHRSGFAMPFDRFRLEDPQGVPISAFVFAAAVRTRFLW